MSTIISFGELAVDDDQQYDRAVAMNEEEKPASWTLAAIKSRGLALEGYC
jgi:hypothetical protein